MPNHFHLLVETQEANLSQFMKRLLGVYTMRFNRRYSRPGHLFQGRYKALLVEKESYLLELSRYIHLNPCRAGLVQDPRKYPWSSMASFVDGVMPPHFLQRETLLSEFDFPARYKEFVLERLGKEGEDLLRKAKAGVFLGSEEFIKQFHGKFPKKKSEGISRQKELTRLTRVSKERIDSVLKNEEPKIRIYGLWKWGRLTQKEIGGHFSKSESTVSRLIKKIETKMTQDSALSNKIKKVESRVASFKN